MRTSKLRLCLTIAVIAVFLSPMKRLWAADLITLAAGERVPYIGKMLPENGYVAELATEAFKRRGYRVEIKFYPLTRARMLARTGEVHGMLPVYREESEEPDHGLVYSNPFPGDAIGLLKKKSLPFRYSQESLKQQGALLESLKGYRLGMVRGGITLPMLEGTNSFVKEMASEDLNNLDKLDFDRIHFALIDKYTAADLITGQRPHLIGRVEFLMPALALRDFYIGFSPTVRNHRQLVSAFNEGLRELTKDGTLSKIRKKHGLFPPKAATPDKVHLTIGTVNNSDMKVMQRLSKEFERQQPKIKLEWRVLDENTLRQRLLSDLAISDGQFDIVTIGSYETPIWAKQGWLMPLSPSEDYDAKDLLPSVRDGLSYNDQLFALPFYAESSMTFYRKDLFAKAGLRMPQRPSYDEVATFAARIHNPAAGVYGICLRGKPGWGENMAFLSTLVNVHGGRWFNETWRPQLDSPEWEKAVTLYRDLLVKYGPPNPERNGFNENLALFSEGRCGMWVDATIAAGLLFDPKRSKVAAQLGYVQAPVALTDKGAAWLWIWALAIPNSSNHKKEAAEFISWATSKNYIQSVARSDGWVSVPPGTRKSTYEKGSYLKAAPFGEFVLNAIEGADIRNSTLKPKPYLGIQNVSIPEFPAIGDQVGLEFAKMLRGEQSVKEALVISQTKALEQMKNSGYINPAASIGPAPSR
jgi:sorbitol/mannitol transport system substrate-binding protein